MYSTIQYCVNERKYKAKKMGSLAGRWVAKEGDGWPSREMDG